MAKRIEGIHTDLPQMITGKRANNLGDGAWENTGAEGIREAAGTHLARIYIERLLSHMAQWVVIRPLFEVCEREKGYERGGRRRKEWWRKKATEKQLRATLVDSREAKRRRRSGGGMGM